MYESVDRTYEGMYSDAVLTRRGRVRAMIRNKEAYELCSNDLTVSLLCPAQLL